MGKLLSKEIDHSSIVGDLIRRLKNEDISSTRKLFKFAHKMLVKFSYCVENESYTAKYYKKLLCTLESLLSVLKTYQGNIQLPLLRTMNSYLTGNGHSAEGTPLCSEDLAAIQVLQIRYADEIHRLYEDFKILFEMESDKKYPVKILSRVEYYLLKLMTLLERSIFNANFLGKRLQEWNVRLIRKENQELYN